ncbi:hypothetical protein E4U41_000393, partial [Claviceps citrina]
MPRTRQPKARTSELRKQAASPDEGWFTIRAILDERRVKGRTEYLVDWDDDATTGEAFDPTWTRDVTDQAKEEWDRTKALRTGKQVEPDSQDSKGSKDSQPPRPANRRQQQRTKTAGPSGASRSRQGRRRRRGCSPTDESEERPRKITKLADSATLSEEPLSSTASLTFTDSAVESASDIDSPGHRRDSGAVRSRKLVVQFQKHSQFDPAEYNSQHNTQHSGLSSQSIAELESQDDRLIFTSQPSRQTIPDSQEPSGQTWSVDFQQAEHESSAQDSVETRHSSRVDDRHRTSDLQQDERQSGGQSGRCVQEAAGHSSEHSNGPDIPSHQTNQRESLTSGAIQDSYWTTSADKPCPEAQSPGINKDLTVVPDTSSALKFVSQAPLPFSFDIPESSPAEVQGSLATSVVEETLSGQNRILAGTSLAAGYLTESQDAQVLTTTPFSVSHVAALTDSHGTDKDGSPLAANTSLPPQASDTGSRPSTVTRLDTMDSSHMARIRSDPAPQMSAADELSRILNLDRVMAEASGSPDSARPLGGAAELSEAQLSEPKVQASQADEEHSQSKNSVVESEHTQGESPSSRVCAVESLQAIVNKVFDGPDWPVSHTIVPDAIHDPEPPTVSLADVLNPQIAGGAALTPIPSLLHQEASPGGVPRTDLPSSAVSVPVDQPQADEESDDGFSDGSREPIVLKHIVTLPFQASLRPLYDDTLLEFKAEITHFGDVFNSEEFAEPDEALVLKLDRVLGRLLNICDYPPDVVGTALEDLPSDQLIKYCCDGNAKFNFLFELLQGLTKETRILIVARSVELLTLLYRLAEALGIKCICRDIGKGSEADSGTSVAKLTLILPGTNVDEDDFDLVVGYDHSFGSSEIGKKLEPEIPDARSPMVLMLVTTHSIEHIDLYVPSDLTALERKNALVSGIVRARQLVGDPDRGYPEPHELASLFLDYLNGLVEGFVWDPVPLPEEILDVFVNSQPRSQMPVTAALDAESAENSRKRKLDDSDDEDVKRRRMFSFKHFTVAANEAPVSDDVQALLSSVKPKENTTTPKGVVGVPVAVLQALAEQVSELRRQVDVADKDSQYKSLISGLETQVKEYERTSAKMYASQREALEDRSRFERQALKAEAALCSANEAAQRDAEKAQKRMADLEATVARLTIAGQDGSAETPLAKTQKLLQEAQEKTHTLEKRLDTAHNDADYARRLYQDATAASSALRAENASLREQVAELGKKTEGTLGKIHAMQADATMRQLLARIRHLKAQLREREIELDCTHNELRLLRNSRRETRH